MSVVLWGPGERAGEAGRGASDGAAVLSPQTSIADLVALARGAAVMVSGDTGPTHIARRRRHADRRHLRADAPGAQRPVVAGRHHRLARRGLRVSSSAALQAANDVPARHRGGRSVAAVERRLAVRSVSRCLTTGSSRRVDEIWRGCACRSASSSARSCSGSPQPTARRLSPACWWRSAGEALRMWAAGHLNKSREVTSSGPYRFVAHPLYVGSSMMGAGPGDRHRAASLVARARRDLSGGRR